MRLFAIPWRAFITFVAFGRLRHLGWLDELPASSNELTTLIAGGAGERVK